MLTKWQKNGVRLITILILLTQIIACGTTDNYDTAEEFGSITGTIGMTTSVSETENVSFNKATNSKAFTFDVTALTVTITSSSNSYSAHPDANGSFIFINVPAGNYSLSIMQAEEYPEIGYYHPTANITVSDGEILDMTIPVVRKLSLEDVLDTPFTPDYMVVDSDDHAVILAQQYSGQLVRIIDNGPESEAVINMATVDGEAFAYNDLQNILYVIDSPYIRLYNENLAEAASVDIEVPASEDEEQPAEIYIHDYDINTITNRIYLIVGTVDDTWRRLIVIGNNQLETSLKVGTEAAFVITSKTANVVYVVDNSEDVVYIIDGNTNMVLNDISFHVNGIRNAKRLAINEATGSLYMLYVVSTVGGDKDTPYFLSLDANGTILINDKLENTIPFTVTVGSGDGVMGAACTGKGLKNDGGSGSEDEGAYSYYDISGQYPSCFFPNMSINDNGSILYIDGFPFQIEELSFHQPKYNVVEFTACESVDYDIAVSERSWIFGSASLEAVIYDTENQYIYNSMGLGIDRYTRDGNDINVNVGVLFGDQDPLVGLKSDTLNNRIYTYDPNAHGLIILE